MLNMLKNEQAIKTFKGKIEELKDKLQALQDYVDDNMEYNLDGVNWSHVGSATIALEEFNKLINFLGVKEPAEGRLVFKDLPIVDEGKSPLDKAVSNKIFVVST